jgi:SAM-dependent methyltransferase
MAHYNRSAGDVAKIPDALVDRLIGLAGGTAFPSLEWLDAPYDAASQMDAHRHLGPADGQRVAQLGGKGIHAVKSLLAGADEAWLLTPMHQEALYASELARRTGVSDRFHTVVGIAEQMPFPSEAFDTIYAGGCLHHMTTDFAGPEIHRVLVRGGRFAAVEPWQTVAHRAGTRLIGKREANAYCRPLNDERLRPMHAAFDGLELRHHGPALRYLALALQKLTRREISSRAGLWLTRIDDALPLPARMGGSIAVLATRH